MAQTSFLYSANIKVMYYSEALVHRNIDLLPGDTASTRYGLYRAI